MKNEERRTKNEERKREIILDGMKVAADCLRYVVKHPEIDEQYLKAVLEGPHSLNWFGGSMMDDRLTQCERSGTIVTFVNPSPQERDAINLQFTALRKQGHAVICDEVTHGDQPPELRIHHYKTCMACVGVKR